MPFEIPDSWEWVKLCYITSVIGDGLHGTPQYDVSGEYFFINGNNLLNRKIIIKKETKRVSLEEYEKYRKPLNSLSILVSINGTIGNVGTFKDEKVVLGKSACYFNIFPNLVKDYICTVIESQYFLKYAISSATGSTIKNVPIQAINDFLIPIPPIEEQKRIVNAIEQWLAVVYALGKETIDLSTSIQQIKSKILDLAIHGKLVKQDHNDEPAINLLQRINHQFIPCDTSHYTNLPQGWTLCKLEDIIDYEQPQEYIVQSTDYNPQYKTPVLTAGKSFIIGYTNEENGICSNLPVIIFDDFTTESKFVDFPFKVKSSAMKILHVKDEINIDYVSKFMSITKLISDTHKRYWISEYSKILIPIPPRNEQERITKKIKEIFMILDNINAEL